MKKLVAIAALFASLVAHAGQLTQTVTISGAAVNLTTIGLVDWSDWNGTSAFAPANDFKSGAGTLPNPSLIGGTFQVYTNDARTINWTNGTNTGTSSNTAGIFNNGGTTGNGLQLILPADTNIRTVKIYISAFSVATAATISATLSDGSASPQTDNTTLTGAVATAVDGVITLVYQANSAAQTLTLQWFINANVGNVGLQAVALNSVTAPPVVGPSKFPPFGIGL